MTGEPTLHYGDHTKDGWVAYAQEQLNLVNADAGEADGWFGDNTINAVYRFQQQMGLLVDGVIGDQTWAALRGDEAVDPHADGHAHEQTDHGMHLIWDAANETVYDGASDRLKFQFTNVGDQEVPSQQFFLILNINGGSHGFKHFELPIAEDLPAGPGWPTWSVLENVKSEIGEGEFTWTGELPAGVNGDKQEGAFTIQ